ncbi:hypothetical protein ATANTOWER_030428 [Ataeniobius toweri]|uniref:Uncharacterized protein n=1 Tax=Ataeniobius toweri TaxID=208326 RepID=A0ABU7AN29_9TELE|nr:hypothetical protein [Ataeniobius toweri]
MVAYIYPSTIYCIFNVPLREGGFSPRVYGTWPCPVFIHYEKVILYSCEIKHHQRIHLPSPCLIVEMWFFRSYLAFLFLQTWCVELIPKTLMLVSFDHNSKL